MGISDKWLDTNVHLPGDTDRGVMARIDAVIPDVLAKRLRITVAQRFGGRKGDLSKGLIEAIEAWVQTDEAAKIARTLAKTIRDANTPSSVKEHAVTALAKTGAAGLQLLAEIGGDGHVPESVRSQALKAIDFPHRR
jgi:alkylation response protein AidB-like acyl-CoA dehydrogenase